MFKVTGNSPADVAGLKADDLLTAAAIDDGEFVPISKAEDLTDLIATASGDYLLSLRVNRANEFNDKVISMRAYDYVASYVTYYDNGCRYAFRSNQSGELEGITLSEGMTVLDDKTAYIRLDQFEGEAAEQLRSALDFMKERGRDKLILDLRNNGGGYMDILKDIASCLIYNGGKRNTVVSYSIGKKDTEAYSFRKSNFYDNVSKIAVIANENTASASECLIGAMLYYGDCFNKDSLIIEKNAEGVARTYGKGIMQTTYGLINGGAFKLTTAYVYWPDKDTCIHGKGITAEGLNATEKGMPAVYRAVATLS